MNSIEFGKKCQPYNKQYKQIFGYIPCPTDYKCTQEEFFEFLLKAIETKQDMSEFAEKKQLDYLDPNIRY